MSWLTDFGARAVSALEDMDKLAAERLAKDEAAAASASSATGATVDSGISPAKSAARRARIRREVLEKRPSRTRESGGAEASPVTEPNADDDDGAEEEVRVVDNARQGRASTAATAAAAAADAPVTSAVATGLQRENTLLRNEVRALEEEVASFATRMRASQDTLADTRKTLAAAEQQLSDARRQRSELQGGLRTAQRHLGEGEAEATRLQEELAALKLEAERLRRDHSAHSDAQARALEQLQRELDEARGAAPGGGTASGALAEAESRVAAAEQRAKALQTEMVAAIALRDELERQTSEQGAAIAHLQQQHSGSCRRYERLSKDFEDYKARAQRILHTRETALETLKKRMAGKGASTQEGEDVAVATSVGGSEEDAAAWATQRERYEDMLADARAEARELQDSLDELQEQSQLEAEQVAAQIRELELAQQQERERRQEAERDYKNHLETLAGERDEALRSKQSLHMRVQEAENQVEQLTKQLRDQRFSDAATAPLAAMGEASAQQSAAEDMLRKQSEIEALRTQLANHKVQLEAERQRVDDAAALIKERTTSSTRWDDSRLLPLYSVTSPASSSRIRDAANALDAFSIRLGVFLRRYPAARLFIICYMILLHAWVMIVLLTYQPEIHNVDHASSNFHPQHPDKAGAP